MSRYIEEEDIDIDESSPLDESDSGGDEDEYDSDMIDGKFYKGSY